MAHETSTGHFEITQLHVQNNKVYNCLGDELGYWTSNTCARYF